MGGGPSGRISRRRRFDEHRRHHEPQLLDRRLSRPHAGDARLRRGDDPDVHPFVRQGSALMPFISIVSGCYNEEENVDELYKQIRDAMPPMPASTYNPTYTP